jgi:DNA-directed RNA polymerase subunit RPC12/RpoP
MTARVSLEEAIVTRPTASTICARCDGPITITKDAIGRERIRCPKCDGVSRIRPHVDDVQLPQGLVRANVVELPPLEPGQLRCQVCAGGLNTNDRFHPECRGAGLLLVQAMRNERNARSGR